MLLSGQQCLLRQFAKASLQNRAGDALSREDADAALLFALPGLTEAAADRQ